MKVYVLVGGLYEDYSIFGVTSSEEVAKKWKSREDESWLNDPHDYEEYELDELPKNFKEELP